MNLNYLFYNKYFDFLADGSNSENINNRICRMKAKINEEEGLPCESFCLKTTYPGLLVGIGNAHDVSKIDGEEAKKATKIGFTFDYVTGLPIIPGSTVKGVLRSAFSEHPDYVLDLLQKINPKKYESCGECNIKELEELMFGSSENVDTTVQDVFFSAIPVKAGKEDRIMGEDFVTPHKSKDGEAYDGLVEPNPVRMFKVIPDVVYRFRFCCKESTLLQKGFEVTKDEKLELFKAIIMDLGMGAKTNVGYGNMVMVSSDNETKYVSRGMLVLEETEVVKNAFEKGQVLKVEVDGAAIPNKKGQGFVAYARIEKKSVTVFGVPQEVKDRDNIQIQLTKVDADKMYGNFISHLRR